MNLLNSIFNYDEIEIINTNKKYFFLTAIIILLISLLFLIQKNNYYSNTFTVVDSEIILLVEKDYINLIKSKNAIIIDNIENNYSIKSITPIDNGMMVSINLNTKINKLKSGVYKIYIGKEKLFDYFVRIIKE